MITAAQAMPMSMSTRVSMGSMTTAMLAMSRRSIRTSIDRLGLLNKGA
jgi:hypothetical protein